MEFKVKGKPPYKQAPADASERQNQKLYRDTLIEEAKMHFHEPLKGSIEIVISYTRDQGRADSMNVIGGIADSLEGVAYGNDR